MILIEIIKKTAEYFAKLGIQNPRLEAEYLIADALSFSRLDLYMQHDRPLEEIELQMLREKVLRRGKKEPLQYILGKVEFFGATIYVNPSVLIPRQETELLLEHIAKESLEGKTLLDLCSGSGCIGIALKKKFPSLLVTLGDISKEALNTARNNAIENKVDVEICGGDLFAPFGGWKFDFIVCNPPYVSEKEWEDLEPEVKDFEPKLALVGGKSGLEFYERVAKGYKSHLNEGGKLFCEIGHLQGKAVLELFPEGEILKDLAGKERFLITSSFFS